uniref:testis-expressed protein 36-like n=1 Tax=Styela clava TaxID=7725 RepID=UPI001939F919|nr:testis-expressed protein 36-like [Styela clava]
MPKGRRFVPTAEHDGIWFQHIGLPNIIENRNTGTTTGLMMNDRFDETAQRLTTIRCPPNYFLRQQKKYRSENPFSWHDNRNSFQDHGVYFGQGLGKKKAHSDTSQHKSNDIVTWGGKKKPESLLDINSLYREDFLGERCSTAPVHRRYSKIYPTPPVGQIKLDTNTTLWVDDKEYVPRTFLQTLANTQEPYLPPNPWKYSYHAQSFAKSKRPKTHLTKRSKIMTAVA